MPSFKKGDTVTLTINGTIAEDTTRVYKAAGEDRDYGATCIKVSTEGGTHFVHLGDRSANVKVTKKTPENWPPQEGDVWRVGGITMISTEDGTLTNAAFASSSYPGIAYKAANLLNDNKEVSLIYRPDCTSC